MQWLNASESIVFDPPLDRVNNIEKCGYMYSTVGPVDRQCSSAHERWQRCQFGVSGKGNATIGKDAFPHHGAQVALIQQIHRGLVHDASLRPVSNMPITMGAQ